MPAADIIQCEDCGEEIPYPQRRTRCRKCRKLVCGHCYTHIHNPMLQGAIEVLCKNRRVHNAKQK